MSLNESKVACKKLKDKWILHECMLISLHALSVWETICDARASRVWHGMANFFAHFAKNTLF